jgi:hypothetical protein
MRFGEYDLMTVAAAGVQMTWDKSAPSLALAMAEKYGAPV